ncbi:MAG: hypothetical protein KKF67_01395, partial [Nanoarchaeota archaeon]|nr:hypothetical protein [Nanoarchaeota archaeon]
MKKRAQFNLPLVTLIILFILLIFLSFLFFKSIQDDKENINNLKDLTRMEQIDDSIQHNISLTNNLPNCQDECSARGLKKCFGIGYKICGNFDSDSCYEWSSINSCGSNEECSSGRCKSVQQEDVSSTENPPTASATRYDFDEIELLSVEQFNVKKIADVANTWADAISGTINNLEVTHAIFNLKRDGKIMKDKEL